MEERRERRDHRIVSGFITMLVCVWSDVFLSISKFGFFDLILATPRNYIRPLKGEIIEIR